MDDTFDHVFAGAGVAGVLLAHRILDHADRGGTRARLRLLLADPHLASDRRETLAFWSRAPTPVSRWTVAAWDQVAIVGHDRTVHRVPLAGWRYTAISWERARSELLAGLADDPRVTLVGEAVGDVRDGADAGRVRVGDTWIRSTWVYDSRPLRAAPPTLRHSSTRSIELLQAFRGVWVQTSDARVDHRVATLLDFSTDSGPDLGFAYVLPVSTSSALVMAVRMGTSPELPDPIPAVRRELGCDEWRVVAEERGVTPLLSPPPHRRAGRRILNIGQRGGRTRPSTGYALTRILADTEAIATSLDHQGHPFAGAGDPRRDRALDAIWLHALARQRADLEPAFLDLFTRSPIGSVLRFLDGRAGAADIARVVTALPARPFLRAAADLTLGRTSR